jgi:hypothetical protein
MFAEEERKVVYQLNKFKRRAEPGRAVGVRDIKTGESHLHPKNGSSCQCELVKRTLERLFSQKRDNVVVIVPTLLRVR